MTADRRTLLAALVGGGALAPILAVEAAMAKSNKDAATLADDAHERLMAVPGLRMHGDEQVAMLLYPGFTALDIVAPHYFFASMMGAQVHLVTTADDLAPVASDLGLAIAPTVTLADCPEALTVVFAPGGTTGALTAAADPAVVRFLRSRAANARCVVSVCTGALLLGAAGLLRGRRATTHWAAMDTLSHFGATPVAERVVTDGRLITGAGVSAGLDLGLALVAELRGRPYAEALMLQAEYRPMPPFEGGAPELTDPAIAEPLREMFAVFREQALKLEVAP